MTLSDAKDFADTAQSVVTMASIIIGGFWVYLRFIRQQERFAHIETAADMVVLGQQSGYWIVEIAAILENKGKVELRLRDLGFDLNALVASDPINISAAWNGQVDFPKSIGRGVFMPAQYSSFFIGPGVKSRYTRVERIPDTATFASLHCFFNYVDRPGASHAMEKNVKLA